MDGKGGRTWRLAFGDTPDVFTPLDDAAIRGLDVLGGPDDGEGHRIDQHAGVVGVLVISLDGGRVDADALRGDNFANLEWVEGGGVSKRNIWRGLEEY